MTGRPVIQLRGAGPTETCPRCSGVVVCGRGNIRDVAEDLRLRCLSCSWHRYMLPVLSAGELIVPEPVPSLYVAIPGVCVGCGTALPIQRGPGRRRLFCGKACGRVLLAA